MCTLHNQLALDTACITHDSSNSLGVGFWSLVGFELLMAVLLLGLRCNFIRVVGVGVPTVDLAIVPSNIMLAKPGIGSPLLAACFTPYISVPFIGP